MEEPTLINDRYRLLNKTIGRGSSGIVTLALDTITNTEVAIKMSYPGGGQAPHLSKEAFTYEMLWFDHVCDPRKHDHFPSLLWHGYIADRYYLVWDLLGPTLHDLWSFCGHRLSVDTVKQLAQQMVSRLTILHARGYIHGSIKPENICMGAKSPHKNTLYLIDYGSAAPINASSPITRATYFSIERHKGHPHDVCDDLESMFYTMLFLLGEDLPWRGIPRHRMAPIKEKETVRLADKYELKDLWLYIRSIAQSREKPAMLGYKPS